MFEKFTIDEQTGCWLWNGTRTRDGYGLIRRNDKAVVATRVMAFLALGFELEKHSKTKRSLIVCHFCDNPPCINPKHLFIGSYSDNRRDAIEKGRARAGTQTHCANGHLFSPENTAVFKGIRRCKTCNRESHRAAYWRQGKVKSRPTEN